MNAFPRTIIMLGGNMKIEIVEHEICLLTSALNHIDRVTSM